MSIATYTDLIGAITEWLARENDATLVARIPDFVRLCEAKLNRDLYHVRMEKRSTASTDSGSTEPQYLSLPSDFQSMRRIRLTGGDGPRTLEYNTQAQLDEFRTGTGYATGRPRRFTIVGTEIELCPSPDQSYEVEMVYRANLQLASDQTNWLIAIAPDAYLYGSLLESAPYINQDERIQVWGAGFSNAIDSLNRNSLTMQMNAQPLQVTASGPVY